MVFSSKKKNEIFKISHSNASSKSQRTFHHHFKLKLIISMANMSISLKEIIKRFAG